MPPYFISLYLKLFIAAIHAVTIAIPNINNTAVFPVLGNLFVVKLLSLSVLVFTVFFDLLVIFVCFGFSSFLVSSFGVSSGFVSGTSCDSLLGSFWVSDSGFLFGSSCASVPGSVFSILLTSWFVRF